MRFHLFIVDNQSSASSPGHWKHLHVVDINKPTYVSFRTHRPQGNKLFGIHFLKKRFKLVVLLLTLSELENNSVIFCLVVGTGVW